MNSSTGRFLKQPVRNTFVGLIYLIVLLLCAGAIYQWATLRRDRRLNPMPGRLVDVGGYRMHIDCTGKGSPTVVLESGLGATWLAWYKVQPLIAQFTQVCSYDRAGYGWSDPSPKPRTAKVIAEELHQLLQNAGVAGPYVLVGHSLGGMIIQIFASLYRGDASALVLVDSVVPHEFKLLSPRLTKYNNEFLREQTWREDTMVFGLPRLMGWCGNGPAAIRSELRTVDCRIGPWKVHLAEYDAFDESSDQALQAGPLGNLPVAVISEDPGKPVLSNLPPSQGFSEDWNSLQAGLTQEVSTDGCRIIAKGANHDIPSERPDMIAAVVRKLVEEVRGRQQAHSTSTAVLLKQFNCVR